MVIEICSSIAILLLLVIVVILSIRIHNLSKDLVHFYIELDKTKRLSVSNRIDVIMIKKKLGLKDEKPKKEGADSDV